MKTLFALLIPFAFFFSTENATIEDSVPSKAKQAMDRIEVTVEVDFGRKRRDCGGFGVCKIKGTAGAGIRPMEAGAMASLTGGQEGEPIIMNFYKKSMSNATVKKFFSESSFVVGEDFKTQLKTKDGTLDIYLKAGKYKIQKGKNGFKVKF